MIEQYSYIKAFSLRSIISFMTFLILTFTGYASAEVNEAIYKEEISQLNSVEKGKSRLVFFGTNYGWYGALAGGKWEPKITINGRDMKVPHGRNIYFVLDVPEGEYKIGTEYPRNYLKKSVYGVPYYHDITQGYTLRAISGKTYYHEMTITTIKTNESFMHDFDYFLSLWRIAPDASMPQFKRMTHWLKAGSEDSNKTNTDKE